MLCVMRTNNLHSVWPDVPPLLRQQGGIKQGEGKYTWPSGAVYRGDWHDGCMHGHGTLQGPDGSIYTGVCCGTSTCIVAQAGLPNMCTLSLLPA